jgi:hypothetical protein
MTFDDAAVGAHGPSRSVRGHATGTQLVHATWALLRQDRELLWLPVPGAVFAVIAAHARRRVPRQVISNSRRTRTGTVRKAA